MADLKSCPFCKALNEEKQPMMITEIRISGAGYYNWRCDIYHCPYCGELLEKYRKGGARCVRV